MKWKTVTRGVSEVASAKECREFAYECLGWAKTAKSGKERGIFLQMADTWLRAAASLEGFPKKAPPDPKSGRNPKTGTALPVPKRVVAYFKSKEMRERLNATPAGGDV